MRVNFVQKAIQTMSVGSTTGLDWHIMTYPILNISFTGVGSFALTLSLESAWSAAFYGAEMTVLVNQNTTGTCSIVWPADFVFSGSDGSIATGAFAVSKYTGVYLPYSGGDGFFMTKTTY